MMDMVAGSHESRRGLKRELKDGLRPLLRVAGSHESRRGLKHVP